MKSAVVQCNRILTSRCSTPTTHSVQDSFDSVGVLDSALSVVSRGPVASRIANKQRLPRAILQQASTRRSDTGLFINNFSKRFYGQPTGPSIGNRSARVQARKPTQHHPLCVYFCIHDSLRSPFRQYIKCRKLSTNLIQSNSVGRNLDGYATHFAGKKFAIDSKKFPDSNFPLKGGERSSWGSMAASAPPNFRPLRAPLAFPSRKSFIIPRGTEKRMRCIRSLHRWFSRLMSNTRRPGTRRSLLGSCQWFFTWRS
jgi:hypothetical protein